MSGEGGSEEPQVYACLGRVVVKNHMVYATIMTSNTVQFWHKPMYNNFYNLAAVQILFSGHGQYNWTPYTQADVVNDSLPDKADVLHDNLPD